MVKHGKTCRKGEIEIESFEKQVEVLYFRERVSGKKAVCWLEYEAKQRNIHIHHALCGNGGQRVAVMKLKVFSNSTVVIIRYALSVIQMIEMK